MRFVNSALILSVVLLGCGSPPQLPNTGDPNVLSAVAATVRVACLNVQGKEVGSGTGVVINGGQILTARHMWEPDYGIVNYRITDITGAECIAEAKKLGKSDWMLLEPKLKLGKAIKVYPGRRFKLFENVFVVGYPVGLAHQTYTEGKIQPFEGKLARISAPIAPGNSGGGAWLPSPSGQPALAGLVVAMFTSRGQMLTHMGIIVPLDVIEEEGGLK